MMSSIEMACSMVTEDMFGPTVAASCLGGFDFTLLFEETILTTVPLGIAGMSLVVVLIFVPLISDSCMCFSKLSGPSQRNYQGSSIMDSITENGTIFPFNSNFSLTEL